MVNTTIEVRGPKRLIRRMYKLARREHDRGLAFCGLFETAARSKNGKEHALRLSRHGYLPLRSARRELAPVLSEAAAREGIEHVEEVVHVDATRGGRGGLLPF